MNIMKVVMSNKLCMCAIMNIMMVVMSNKLCM